MITAGAIINVNNSFIQCSNECVNIKSSLELRLFLNYNDLFSCSLDRDCNMLHISTQIYEQVMNY